MSLCLCVYVPLSVSLSLCLSVSLSLCVSLSCSGHFDPGKTVPENLKMSAPLLSRFDLIYILLDKADVKRGFTLSHYTTCFNYLFQMLVSKAFFQRLVFKGLFPTTCIKCLYQMLVSNVCFKCLYQMFVSIILCQLLFATATLCTPQTR